jgi:hypothetical protein
VDGFVTRHGTTRATVLADGAEVPRKTPCDGVRLVADDGATAVLTVPWPPLAPPPTSDPSFVAGVVARHAARPRTVGLLLVRRGGWAVGTARDGRLLVHKTGSRYVQSRTAAGGWSQQRYARRRGNQADALVSAVVEAAATRLDAGSLDGLVPGGDRGLVDAVLADPALAAVAALPRGPLLDVPDPKAVVLEAAAARARAVRVLLDQP